jgi:hypothetical protein
MNEQLKELLLVFAQTERELEEYLPRWSQKVHVYVEGEEWITDCPRFSIVCALCKYAKRGETEPGPAGQLLSEISSLCYIIREMSGHYNWLVWHPEQVRLDDEYVDSSIYGVWDVLRRLCNITLGLNGLNRPLPKFADVMSPFLILPTE